MLVTTGAVTKRIDRLTAQGLVTRGPAASDGRGRIVALTERGRELVDRLIDRHLANEQRLLGGAHRPRAAAGSPSCCTGSRCRSTTPRSDRFAGRGGVGGRPAAGGRHAGGDEEDARQARAPFGRDDTAVTGARTSRPCRSPRSRSARA